MNAAMDTQLLVKAHEDVVLIRNGREVCLNARKLIVGILALSTMDGLKILKQVLDLVRV